MPDVEIRIEGLGEIRRRMSQYPDKWREVVKHNMTAALIYIWSNIPPYPRRPKNPYIRKLTLSRSLGVDDKGNKQGEPSIYKVETQGMDATGEFGTNLEYAPYVIGERQAWMHQPYWWTLHVTVFNKVKDGIERIFKNMGDDIAAWLGK